MEQPNGPQRKGCIVVVDEDQITRRPQVSDAVVVACSEPIVALAAVDSDERLAICGHMTERCCHQVDGARIDR